jgi:hypothetical protein
MHLSMVARLLLFLDSWLPYSVFFCLTPKNRLLRARLVAARWVAGASPWRVAALHPSGATYEPRTK